MKKLFTLLCLIAAGNILFAQTESRKLLSGVYSLAFETTDNWEILQPGFTKVNPVNDQYEFIGGFTVKNIVGYVRYDFTCTIEKASSDFSVKLKNMNSYSCSKDGVRTNGAKTYATSDKVAGEYAKQMKSEIQSRMKKWSDKEYNDVLNKAVTSPAILKGVSKNSKLIYKKFLSDNSVIGKSTSFKIVVTGVDEATSGGKKYAYYVSGKTLYGYDVNKDGIKMPDYLSVAFYTNDDNVLSLTPAEKVMGVPDFKNSGSVYEVKGTINSADLNEAGDLRILVIHE